MVKRSSLYVEGTDDKHAIKHLLARRGVDCPFHDEIAPATLPPTNPEIRPAGDKGQVLGAMEPAVKFGTGLSVGFVLDADSAATNSWHAVRDRLSFLKPKPPRKLPATGFVANVPAYRVRVGVWIMPDNRASGALENFLLSLIDADDLLLPLAYESTDRAKDIGANFSEIKREKAVIHAWLSWQQEPGLPFGTALAARYFNADTHSALPFLRWFDDLFGTNSAADSVADPSG